MRKQEAILCKALEMFNAFRDACINTEGLPELFLFCTLSVSMELFARRNVVEMFGTRE
jgi:hypothetical protein